MVAGKGTPPTTAHHGHAGQVGTWRYHSQPTTLLEASEVQDVQCVQWVGSVPGPFDGLG